MKELDLRPYTQEGTRFDENDPMFFLRITPFPPEVYKGCSLCQSPMIASGTPFCSNPACFGYTLKFTDALRHNLHYIYYKDIRIFYFGQGNIKFCLTDDYLSLLNHEKTSQFLHKLFLDIMKAHNWQDLLEG